MKVSLLVVFTSLLPLVNASAQKALTYKDSGAQIEIGDSVKINRDSLYYSTGERILHWVYDQTHVVRQVGSKYHPDGILLKGIYSWIPADLAIPVSNKEKATVADTTTPAKVDTPSVSKQEELVVAPETAKAPEGVVEEPVVEQPKEEVTSEPVVESTPVVESETVAEESKRTQMNRFTIGVRGGFASSMAKPAKLPLGGDVLLDLQYAHYWAAGLDKTHFGILTGLSVGYMSATRNHQAWNETFTANTSDGDVIYNVTADNIKETNHQLQLEVPVMFSMITKGGLFLNVGPRFLLPAYAPYKQTISNGNIAVTDVETGVALENNPVYGALTEQQENQKGKGGQQFKLTMTIGVELGYEFRFKSGNSLGLGAFANYGVYSMYSNKPLGSAIEVAGPNASDNGVVNVESLTNAYTENMGHMDVGVKLTYNFNFFK